MKITKIGIIFITNKMKYMKTTNNKREQKMEKSKEV